MEEYCFILFVRMLARLIGYFNRFKAAFSGLNVPFMETVQVFGSVIFETLQIIILIIKIAGLYLATQGKMVLVNFVIPNIYCICAMVFLAAFVYFKPMERKSEPKWGECRKGKSIRIKDWKIVIMETSIEWQSEDDFDE